MNKTKRATATNMLRCAIVVGVLLLPTIANAQARDDRGSSSSDDVQQRRRSREERRQSREGSGNVERESSSASSSSSAGTSTASANRYDVLVENNIFLKDRRARPTTSAASTQPAPRPLTPEQAVYLTGVIFEDGAFRAYFETLDGSPARRVSPGDAIAKGRVMEIQIDTVAYATPDGRITWVEIGHDLTGSTPAAGSGAVVAAPSGGGAGGGVTPSPAAPTDPALMSAAERMRLRRQQEVAR
jgi:hypothetical protein